MKMDWQKIAIAILTAATTVMALMGAITTEESGTLAATGTAAVTGIGGFAVAVASIVRAHREQKKKESAEAKTEEPSAEA